MDIKEKLKSITDLGMAVDKFYLDNYFYDYKEMRYDQYESLINKLKVMLSMHEKRLLKKLNSSQQDV